MATADELHLLKGDIVRVGKGIFNIVNTSFLELKIIIGGLGPKARVLERDEEGRTLVKYLEPCYLGKDKYPVGTLEYIGKKVDCFKREVIFN